VRFRAPLHCGYESYDYFQMIGRFELEKQSSLEKNPFLMPQTRVQQLYFDGDVYIGFLDTCATPQKKYKFCKIVCVFFRVCMDYLKPLNLMQVPMEMGTKLPIGESNIRILKPTITNALNKELQEGELFVNLASTEYFLQLMSKHLKFQ
jgi:cytoplasmic iron level regulating protein YaaA (DUF328/UPF0246 family)